MTTTRPSFMRKIIEIFDKTSTITFDEKIKTTKNKTVKTFKTEVKTEKYIKLSCGHEYRIAAYGKDRSKTKSMNCHYCDQKWQGEANDK